MSSARRLRGYLDTEAAGGVVLVVAAAVALAWANSPWSSAYATLSADAHRVVNDGLMSVFFLVVGLEIRRELLHGELRDRRVAALPAVAALGGMVVPALLYLAVAGGSGGSRGWGIPMATDIAFAMGVLVLLGDRVPGPLKAFLLTLAIVDDIGAIVVIAVFYAGGLEPAWLGVAAALLVLVVLLGRTGVRSPAPAILLGVALWVAVDASGVHPTIAGVALGLLAPPPLERLEDRLHPWTSLGVVPLFALVNAGVAISGDAFGPAGATAVCGGVIVGLVAGKTVGITLASALAVRSRLGRLPQHVSWPMVAGVGAVGGVGFTVSLFVAELAFAGGPFHAPAKVGVLAGSAAAAAAGSVALALASRPVRGGTARPG